MKGFFRIAMVLSCCAAATACTSNETPSAPAPSEAAPAEGEAAQAGGQEEAAEAEEAPAEAEEAPASQPTSQPTADNAGGEAAHQHEGGGMDHVLAEGDYDPDAVVRQPGAELGDLARCPVSGEVFEVTEDATYVAHEGKNVYFCCPGCIRRFQRDPERWLATQPS